MNKTKNWFPIPVDCSSTSKLGTNNNLIIYENSVLLLALLVVRSFDARQWSKIAIYDSFARKKMNFIAVKRIYKQKFNLIWASRMLASIPTCVMLFSSIDCSSRRDESSRISGAMFIRLRFDEIWFVSTFHLSILTLIGVLSLPHVKMSCFYGTVSSFWQYECR